MSQTLIQIINHMGHGGAQKIVYSLIKELRHRFSTVLICRPGIYSNLLDSYENITVIDRDKLSVFRLNKLINSLREQSSKLIIHTHNRKDILIRFLTRNSDRHLHTFHSAYPDKNYIYYFLKPQRAISVSETVQKYLSHYNIPSTLIYNGVNNISLLPKERKISLNSEKRKLLYVGRLGSEKGIFHLLKALKEYRKICSNFDFTLIGEGELKERLEKFCLTNKMDHFVFFKGAKSNPWENSNHYDLLIIPSLFEGFGLVGVEATLAGIPVITNDLAVLREVLNFIPDKCFFNSHSPPSIISAIQYVFNNYSEVYKLTLLHCNSFKEKYALKNMVDNYLKVYIG